MSSHFQQDSALGSIYVQLLDCLFVPAADVTLTVSPSGATTQVCAAAGLAGFACADAGPGVASHAALIINVPVGNVQVTAWAPGVSTPIGTYTVYVRAGSGVDLIALPKPQ